MISRKARIVILKPWIVIDKPIIMDDYPWFLVYQKKVNGLQERNGVAL